jgi:hypothetical protein
LVSAGPGDFSHNNYRKSDYTTVAQLAAKPTASRQFMPEPHRSAKLLMAANIFTLELRPARSLAELTRRMQILLLRGSQAGNS